MSSREENGFLIHTLKRGDITITKGVDILVRYSKKHDEIFIIENEAKLSVLLEAKSLIKKEQGSKS